MLTARRLAALAVLAAVCAGCAGSPAAAPPATTATPSTVTSSAESFGGSLTSSHALGRADADDRKPIDPSHAADSAYLAGAREGWFLHGFEDATGGVPITVPVEDLPDGYLDGYRAGAAQPAAAAQPGYADGLRYGFAGTDIDAPLDVRGRAGFVEGTAAGSEAAGRFDAYWNWRNGQVRSDEAYRRGWAEGMRELAGDLAASGTTPERKLLADRDFADAWDR